TGGRLRAAFSSCQCAATSDRNTRGSLAATPALRLAVDSASAGTASARAIATMTAAARSRRGAPECVADGTVLANMAVLPCLITGSGECRERQRGVLQHRPAAPTTAQSEICTNFDRLDAPLLIVTAALGRPKCRATRPSSSALAAPSRGADLTCASHTPSLPS